MFDNDIFDEVRKAEPSAAGQAVGKLGIWLLHLTKLSFLAYSGAHGISAALGYAGSSGWQQLAQVVGIVVIEASLLGIYLAAMNGKIEGGAQAVSASLTYGLGFILACLGVAADSQLNAGLAISGWLEGYLKWGLPLAPGLMALGSLAIHTLEPAKQRERAQAQATMLLEDERFRASLANERAKLEEERTIRKMQLQSRKAVLQQLYHVYSGEDVQKAIAETAAHNAPALLRAAGIDIEGLGLPQARPQTPPTQTTVVSAENRTPSANGHGRPMAAPLGNSSA